MRTVDSPTHKFSFLFSTLTNSWKFLSGTTSYFLQQHPLHQTTAADLLSFPISVRERFVCNQAKKPAPDPSAVRPTYQNPTLFLKLFSMPSSNQPSVYQPQHNLLDPNQLGVKQALALAEFQKRSTLLALPPFSWSSSLLTCLLCVAQPATNYFLLQWHVHESRPWGLRT